MRLGSPRAQTSKHEAGSSRQSRTAQVRLGGNLDAGERADLLGHRGRGSWFGGTAQKGRQGRVRKRGEARGSEADGGIVL